MFWSETIVAGEDLSAAPQFIAINLTDGKAAAVGPNAGGILQNRPKSGEHAVVYYAGQSEFRAGGTVTKGARLSVAASGYLTVSVSGGLTVGKSLAAVASGGIGRGHFFFSVPSQVTSA